MFLVKHSSSLPFSVLGRRKDSRSSPWSSSKQEYVILFKKNLLNNSMRCWTVTKVGISLRVTYVNRWLSHCSSKKVETIPAVSIGWMSVGDLLQLFNHVPSLEIIWSASRRSEFQIYYFQVCVKMQDSYSSHKIAYHHFNWNWSCRLLSEKVFLSMPEIRSPLQILFDHQYKMYWQKSFFALLSFETCKTKSSHYFVLD